MRRRTIAPNNATRVRGSARASAFRRGRASGVTAGVIGSSAVAPCGSKILGFAQCVDDFQTRGPGGRQEPAEQSHREGKDHAGDDQGAGQLEVNMISAKVAKLLVPVGTVRTVRTTR